MSVDFVALREAMANMLVGSVPAAESVEKYQIADFKGKSPVVLVTRSGFEPSRDPDAWTFGGPPLLVYFDIHVFVLYASGDGTWTDLDSENTVDTIAHQVMAAIQNNQQRAGLWNAIDFADRSQIRPLVLGGEEYRREIIPIAVHAV